MSADIIDSHLINIVNNGIFQIHYSETTQTAYVKRIFKKDDGTQVKKLYNCKLVEYFLKYIRKVYP